MVLTISHNFSHDKGGVGGNQKLLSSQMEQIFRQIDRICLKFFRGREVANIYEDTLFADFLAMASIGLSGVRCYCR